MLVDVLGEVHHHRSVILRVVAAHIADLLHRRVSDDIYLCISSRTYLMRDTDTVNNFEEGQTKLFATMHTVHANESEQCHLKLPDTGSALLNPVSGDREVTVSIGC